MATGADAAAGVGAFGARLAAVADADRAGDLVGDPLTGAVFFAGVVRAAAGPVPAAMPTASPVPWSSWPGPGPPSSVTARRSPWARYPVRPAACGRSWTHWPPSWPPACATRSPTPSSLPASPAERLSTAASWGPWSPSPHGTSRTAMLALLDQRQPWRLLPGPKLDTRCLRLRSAPRAPQRRPRIRAGTRHCHWARRSRDREPGTAPAPRWPWAALRTRGMATMLRKLRDDEDK